MKCLYCGYKDGWILGVEHNGEEGDFFRISNDIQMEREGEDGYHSTKDKNNLIGCPKCNKVFMD